MHPEIVTEKPGKCPICHMKLIPVSKVKKDEEPDSNLKSYTPLIVVFLLLIVSSLIVSLRVNSGLEGFLLSFMTGFFLIFGMFKLFDLKGFAEGYSTYDLLAQRVYSYGYIYPFIELLFGLIMLAGFHPDWLLWIEVFIMTFSGVGVVLKLLKRERIQCVCLGTFLKVPLTYVTLIEDFGMALIALILIFM